MMSFCRKGVHSFLGLTNLNCNNYYSSFEPIKSSSSSSNDSSPHKHGLGLITADEMGEEGCRTTSRVIESSVLKLLPSSPPSSVARGLVFLGKKDPGGIGFIDEVGGGVDGLMSCTESLGFESSDERTVDDGIELLGVRVESSATETSTTTTTTTMLSSPPCTAQWRKVEERSTREMKRFPPPLSWLNKNGQPSFFLRPVRKDGRLELTEVRIDRPQILRACRENGRLRLHLIREEDDHFDHLYENNESEQEEEEQNQNQEHNQDQDTEVKVEVEDENEDEDKEEIEEKLMEEENREVGESIGEWKFPVTGEGLIRRCNEPVVVQDYHRHPPHHHHNMSHHHHNLHVWGQQYVITR